MSGGPDDEFTELIDADFPRVDLVGKAANGVGRFLIAKSSAGTGPALFDAGMVTNLIAKSDAARAAQGEPMSTTTVADTRGPAAVTKAGELDAGVVLATPKGSPGGAPDQPGSPAWEGVDAATAMKWSAILARAENAVRTLAEREELEAFVTGEPCGGEIWDLDDAAASISYAIDALASFAVGEQAESDLGAEAMSGVAKAADGLLAGDALASLEGLVRVAKAGRVLSTANEKLIRGACDSLQTVLANLPAPIEPVAKEKTMSEDTTKAGGGAAGGTIVITAPAVTVPTAAVAKGELAAGDPVEVDAAGQVTKAGAVPSAEAQAAATTGPTPEETIGMDNAVAKAAASLMAVYSQSGKLLGAIDPGKLTPLQDADAGAEDPNAAEEEPPAEPVTNAADLAPAPPGTVGTPAEALVSKEAIETIVEKQVKAALDAKDAEHASVVKALQDRLGVLEGPAQSRVLSNGALPPAHLLRGMTEGAGAIDVAKAAELTASFEGETNVVRREAVAKQMNEAAIAELTRMRQSTVRS